MEDKNCTIVPFHIDIMPIVLTMLEFEDVLKIRLVCKRMKELSYVPSVLRYHYNAAYLPRAFGPDSWHSIEDLDSLLLRNYRLESSLDYSGPPIDMPYRSYDIKEVRTKSSIYTRFLFNLSTAKTMNCYDLDSPTLDGLWSFDLNQESFDRFIRAFDRSDAVEEDSTVISILLRNPLAVLKLHVKDIIGKSPRFVLTTMSEYNSEEVHPQVAGFQKGWIFSREASGPGLYDTITGRKYHTEKYRDHHKIQARECLFAGDHRVVCLVAEHLTTSVVLVYNMPRRDEQANDSCGDKILNCIHYVPLNMLPRICWVSFVGIGSSPYTESPWKDGMGLYFLALNDDDHDHPLLLNITLPFENGPFFEALSDLRGFPGTGALSLGQHRTRCFRTRPRTSTTQTEFRVTHALVNIFPDIVRGYGFGKPVRMNFPLRIDSFRLASRDFDELRGRFCFITCGDETSTMRVHIIEYFQ